MSAITEAVGTVDSDEIPLVTVCLPVYNAEGFIRKPLDSIRTQTYKNVQILISDDASTDDSFGYCSRIAKQDRRIRLIRQTRNLGWVDNVNALLHEVPQESTFVLIAAHDDELQEKYVERLVTALSSHPTAVLAFSDIVDTNPDGSSREVSFSDLNNIRKPAERAVIMASKPEGWWVPFRGLVRSSAARTLGGLRKHRRGEMAADWPWLLGLAIQGEFVRVPETLCFKNRRIDGLSSTWDRSMKSFLASIRSSSQVVLDSKLPFQAKLAVHIRLGLLALTLLRWKIKSLIRPRHISDGDQ